MPRGESRTYKAAEDHAAKVKAIQQAIDMDIQIGQVESCTVNDAQKVIIALANAGFTIKRTGAK
jgi:hypothetical protein